MIDLTRAQSLFSEHQISLSLSQLEQLDRYAQLLVEWNQKMNLTAITDPEGILIKHFLDSIYPLAIDLIKPEKRWFHCPKAPCSSTWALAPDSRPFRF